LDRSTWNFNHEALFAVVPHSHYRSSLHPVSFIVSLRVISLQKKGKKIK